MRRMLRLHALVGLVLCPIVTASAQTSQSNDYVYDYHGYLATGYGYNGPFTYWVGQSRCNNSLSGQGGSSTACSTTMTAGAGAAYTSSDNASRSLSATTTLTQSGSGGQMSGEAVAWSQQWNAIAVTGTSGAGDQLLFHFQTSRAFGFLGTNGGSMQSFYELYLDSGQESAQMYGYDYPSAPHQDYAYNVAGTPNGVDFTLGFDTFSGAYSYRMLAEVSTSHSADQYAGAYGSSVFGATLIGIDDIDAQGNLIASAVFGTDGSATLDVTSAPEPATLTLFGSGFSMLAGVTVLRRRRA